MDNAQTGRLLTNQGRVTDYPLSLINQKVIHSKLSYPFSSFCKFGILCRIKLKDFLAVFANLVSYRIVLDAVVMNQHHVDMETRKIIILATLKAKCVFVI